MARQTKKTVSQKAVKKEAPDLKDQLIDHLSISADNLWKEKMALKAELRMLGAENERLSSQVACLETTITSLRADLSNAKEEANHQRTRCEEHRENANKMIERYMKKRDDTEVLKNAIGVIARID